MRLAGPGGSYLELHVVGYQFPGRTPHPGDFDWDANWLIVDGRASDGERSWNFRDPCLLTIEGQELVVWLDAVAADRPGLDATNFTEPNLEFRRMSAPSEPPVVRVTLRLEARPPWATGVAEEDWDSTWLEFGAQHDDLRAAAAELRSELARYPRR
jgi:hypothetical protein